MFKRLFSIVLVITFFTSLAPGCQRPAKKPEGPSSRQRTAEQQAPRTMDQPLLRISSIMYPPSTGNDQRKLGSKFQGRIVELVNIERQNVGQRPLLEDPLLDKGASLKAIDMRDNSYFSHTSPTYGGPFQQMRSLDVPYQTAAENIAAGYKTPEAVVAGWMNSPGHRANILNGSFGKIGVGYGPGGEAGAYWVQWFTD
ncbi:MAG TPA: CAP domain-containing protein [Bacillota bacterium]|nr:CAP domain-containing protein [Bacillota bacterium]